MDAQEQDLWADTDKERSDFCTRRAFHAFTVTVIVAASEHRAASAASASAVVELGRCCALRVVQLRYAKPSECRRLLKVEPVPTVPREQTQIFLVPRLC